MLRHLTNLSSLIILTSALASAGFAQETKKQNDDESISLSDRVVEQTENSLCDEQTCSDGPFSRSFASFELLYMWSKGRSLPPLVTTDPSAVPPPINSGAPSFTPIALTLTNSTTQVLLGNERVGGDPITGGRLTLGWWLDDDNSSAIGGRFYGTKGNNRSYSFGSTGTPLLGRPFFNTDPLVNAQDALIVAYPAFSTGNIGVSTSHDFIGSDLFFRTLLNEECDRRSILLQVTGSIGWTTG